MSPRLLLALLLWLCLPVVAVEPNAPPRADWSVRVTPFDQVFPALELSQARRDGMRSANASVLGGGSGLIAVRVRARHANEQVQLGVDAPGLDAPTLLDATLARAEVEYELHPPLAWNLARWFELDAPRTAKLRFTLTRDGVAAGENTLAVSLRPPREALYFVRDGRDSVDLSWIFAAYVNEHDPVVDRVLTAAAQSGIVDKFDGYTGADPRQVYRQVWALWQALVAHGIRYSDADPGIARGPHEFSQRVRLLDETWSDRSANCVDGSVLIASVLQRIGLRSFLVLVPGHAFVGFYADADAQHAEYLETTLLGATPPALATLPGFAQGIAAARDSRSALASFAAALASGRARHARAASKFDGRHRPDYAVIDIAAARAYGIRPIAAAIEAAAAANRAGIAPNPGLSGETPKALSHE